MAPFSGKGMHRRCVKTQKLFERKCGETPNGDRSQGRARAAQDHSVETVCVFDEPTMSYGLDGSYIASFQHKVFGIRRSRRLPGVSTCVDYGSKAPVHTGQLESTHTPSTAPDRCVDDIAYTDSSTDARLYVTTCFLS